MIDIGRHIEILLLSNDCVIVPGLGGFMTHYVDARFDDADRMFLPPLRTIGFNPQLTLNDSLLAQSYVEAYDISYPEALKRIEDEVAELKQRLENEGHYELPDVGVLSLNADRHYVFEPCEAGLLTPSLYGLDGFQMDPLETKSVSNASANGASTEAGLQLAPATRTVDSSAGQQRAGKERRRTVTLSLAAVHDMAAACIAVLIFFLFASPLNNNSQTEMKKSGIDTEFLTRVMPRSVNLHPKAQPATQPFSSTHAQAVPSPQAKPASATVTPNHADEAKDASYYCIVLASHVARGNAEDFVERLAKAGFAEARVLTPAKASRKVVYGRYASEREALNALNKLDSDKRFADGWVLHVK